MTRLARFLNAEGSTRSAGLIRIGLALLLWARFAGDIAPFTPNGMGHPLLAGSFFASTTLMLLGIGSQLSTAWAGATLLFMVYGAGPTWMEPWTHHHTTILAHATALLALAPCGRSYSVDRWRTGRPEVGPVWPLKLIAFQLSVLYLASAWDKCNAAFLSGERLQHVFMTLYWGADPVTIPGFAAMCALTAWVVIAIEIVLPIGMWFERFQPPLILAGLALHALFWLGVPVGTFSLTMALLYLSWIDPDRVHAVLDRLQGHPTD